MKTNLIKTGLSILGFLFVVSSGLSADTPTELQTASDVGANQPNWYLNGDGVFGGLLAPKSIAGDDFSGLGAGLEYVPNYLGDLGFNVDYDYQSETGGAQLIRDRDLDLSLRFLTPNRGQVRGWLQVGTGYNFIPNSVDGRFLAFVEPGVRWFVAPRLALNFGVRYMSQTPQRAFIQSLGANLGFSIPLDASYIPGAGCAKAAPASVQAQAPATVSTPVAILSHIVPFARPPQGETATYVVRKGDSLWSIAYRAVGDPALWPLLTAGGVPIENPNSIFEGDRLGYRRSYTVQEIARAVKTAAAFSPLSRNQPVQ